MKQTLETQQKLNKYIMYAIFAGLIIITVLSIAGVVFGVLRINTAEKYSKTHPVEDRYIPAIGGQIAITYDYPTSDAINDMITQGYEVVAIVYDNLKDQAIVVYKRVK